MAYTFEWTVNVSDTDFSGRIYTPQLVKCMALGLEHMMMDIGYGPKRAFDEGIVYPIVHTEASYLEALGLHDVVDISMTPELGTTSLTLTVVGRQDGERVVEGELTCVFTDEDTGGTVPIPAAVRRDLETFQAADGPTST